MLKAFSFSLCVLIPALARGADPALLNMVMPDAKVLAGLQVDKAKNSAFGQFILSHMQIDDARSKQLLSETAEILMASEWSDADSRWLFLARGEFNVPKSTSSDPSAPTDTTAIAYLDSNHAAMGDPASVKAAVQRFQQRRPLTSLSDKVASLSAANDFWFITLAPVSEFSGAMPDPNLGQAMQGNLVQGITEASGGVRFGDPVRFSAEAVTDSEKDANSLLEIVHFLAGIMKGNREKNTATSQVGSLLDSLDAKANGKVVTLSLSVPESQLEQIMNSARQETKQPVGKP